MAVKADSLAPPLLRCSKLPLQGATIRKRYVSNLLFRIVEHVGGQGGQLVLVYSAAADYRHGIEVLSALRPVIRNRMYVAMWRRWFWLGFSVMYNLLSIWVTVTWVVSAVEGK
jgi:hypothetical protein